MDFTACHTSIHLELQLLTTFGGAGDDFTRSGSGSSQHAADHHKIGTKGEGLDDVTGITNSTIRDD